MKAALEGIKVADFTWAMTGPHIIRCLADYGATVARIESAKRPCMQRFTAPYKDGKAGIDRSGFFAYQNANKYSISLDMNNPKAREVALRLVAWADIVAENFTPGQMEKWNLSYEEIKKINPGVIMLRTAMQGQTGPHSKHPGMGNSLGGLAGFVHLTGYADRDPSPVPLAYTDFIGPRLGITVLLAALDYRARTGKGQCIDLSQFEASLYFLGPALLDYTVNGRVAERMGNASPTAAPHGIYRCQGDDRWCAVSVCSDGEWEIFCQALGNPVWTKDARFASLEGRKTHEAELDKLVGDALGHFAAEQAMDLLQKAGIAAGIVAKAGDVYEDPQLKHRNWLWSLDHKVLGKYNHLGEYSILSKTPAVGRFAAPILGEHTEKVCKEFLGMPDDEFDELKSSGIFQ